MDDFLRSFVTKVNVHSDTACDQDEARRVMEVLLPFVHERTPPDCLDKVLSSLSTLSCAMPDAFEACGGYERARGGTTGAWDCRGWYTRWKGVVAWPHRVLGTPGCCTCQRSWPQRKCWSYHATWPDFVGVLEQRRCGVL